MSQGTQVASTSWKSQGDRFSPRAVGGSSPADNLISAQWDRALQTSGLQNCEIINWHCL